MNEPGKEAAEAQAILEQLEFEIAQDLRGLVVKVGPEGPGAVLVRAALGDRGPANAHVGRDTARRDTVIEPGQAGLVALAQTSDAGRSVAVRIDAPHQEKPVFAEAPVLHKDGMWTLGEFAFVRGD